MEPRVIPRTAHCVSRKDIRPEALKVLYRLQSCGHVAYLAGGCVRDLLLHRRPKDFDAVTDAHPNRIRSLFHYCRLIGRRFRLAHVVFPDVIIEVATFRSGKEHEETEDHKKIAHTVLAAKTRDGLIVRDNVFGTPEEDALRRDFTVNALFYNVRDFSILDYVHGMDDLHAGLIRSIGDPRARFVEDPVRILRAIRFASALNFRIDDRDHEAIVAHRGNVRLASKSRLYEEILKLFFCGNAVRVCNHLDQTGVGAVLFPDFAEWLATPDGRAALPKLELALQTLDDWGRNDREVTPALFWAMLFSPYHEALIRARIAHGTHPVEAGSSVVALHLSRVTQVFQLPKQVTLTVRDIMALQPKLQTQNRRDAARLPHRPAFADAVAYFQFMAKAEQRNQSLAAWWAAQIPHQRTR